MRLYIEDKGSGEKTHLQLTAKSRQELVSTIGGYFFVVNGKQYHVRDVKAELGADSATVAALIGGFIGALGGPAGVVVGSAIGALLGSGQTEQEKKEAQSKPALDADRSGSNGAAPLIAGQASNSPPSLAGFGGSFNAVSITGNAS